MKRTAMLVAVLSVAFWATAQTSGKPAQQNPPAPAGQTAAAGQAQGQPATGNTTTPARRPPQTKTQPEFDAWKAADTSSRPSDEEKAAAQKNPADVPKILAAVAARTEKAADDFATKFPDSEVRALLYTAAMRNYQNVNNSERTEAMGRKVLSFDGDNPEALVTVAEVIAERTRDSDLDKDQRYDEAIKMAQKATQTVDTDLVAPPGQLEKAKALIRSNAYSIIGTIEFRKENYPAAQADLQKSIDAYPDDLDPVVVLRLALVLDRQEKYPEALKVANHALEVAQSKKGINPQVVTTAQRERDRLQQLTGSTAPPAPAQPQSQPPKN